MSIQHTSHARYELWYHFAWSTKYRKKVFTVQRTQETIENIFRTIAAHYDIQIGAICCVSDHIHFTAAAPPRIAPARIAQILKSVSTKMMFRDLSWLKKYYWGGEIWVAGYFVRSVGPGMTKEQIERYVREQSEEI